MIGLLAASFRGCVWLLALLVLPVVAADTVKIGMTFPNTGRYKNLGIDQARGALLAIDEINAAGGVLGKPLELLLSASGRKGKEQEHVSELVNAGVSMAFGSSLQPQATAGNRHGGGQCQPAVFRYPVSFARRPYTTADGVLCLLRCLDGGQDAGVLYQPVAWRQEDVLYHQR